MICVGVVDDGQGNHLVVADPSTVYPNCAYVLQVPSDLPSVAPNWTMQEVNEFLGAAALVWGTAWLIKFVVSFFLNRKG